MSIAPPAITPAARKRAERYAEDARRYGLNVEVTENDLGQVQVIVRRGTGSRFLQIIVTHGRNPRSDRTRVMAFEHNPDHRRPRSRMRRLSAGGAWSVIRYLSY